MKFFTPVMGIAILFVISCIAPIPQTDTSRLQDGKYDTNFPEDAATKSLSSMVQSVKKLISTVYYHSYTLPRDAEITGENLGKEQIKAIAIGDTFFNQSVIGTATVLLSNQEDIALLTCDHVVNFPDTIVHYFPETEATPKNSVVNVVAYKVRQSQYIADFPQDATLDILAIDSERDLAIVGAHFNKRPNPVFSPFDFPFGNTRELDWGNVVYLFGYPLGHQMLTSGIVSRVASGRRHGFLIDASFNQGMSGGPVLAIRDGAPNFELVGIANAVAAESNYILRPDRTQAESQKDYVINVPYEGKIFAERHEQIRYGVTFVISIEDIIRFLKKNHTRLLARGYDLSEIYSQD